MVQNAKMLQDRVVLLCCCMPGSNGLLQWRQPSFSYYSINFGGDTEADINGVKENVEYIFSIDVLLLLALVAPWIEHFWDFTAWQLLARDASGTQMYSL